MPLFKRGTKSSKTKTVRVGIQTPIQTLDPREAQDSVSVFALLQIYETPFRDPEGGDSPRPVLFEGPLRSTDDKGTLFRGRVRPGIRFSDGSPLTADRLADSLSRSQELTRQARIRVEGDDVVFELERPNPRFNLVLTQAYTAVTLATGEELLGTGAFVRAPDSTDERLRLTRNPEFHGTSAIEEVIFQHYPSDPGGWPTALLEALESGEVDFSNALSREEVKELTSVRKWFQPGASTTSLYFNVQRSYLSSRAVRHALALALDRSELTKISYENALAFTATSLLPPVMGSWRDGLAHRPDRARTVLGDSGIELPPRLRLLTVWGPRPYLPYPRRTGEMIGDQLAANLGIDGVEVRSSDDGDDFYARGCDGNYDLVLGGWIADTPDPADFLEANLASGSVPERDKSPAIRMNMGHWKDPETDEALRAYRRRPGDDTKNAVLQRVADEIPLLPIMYGPTIAVHSYGLRGFEPTPIGFPRFSELDVDPS